VQQEAWWKGEHGKRKNQRETGKLFGYRNVIFSKVVKKTNGYASAFVWPDPTKMAQAKHLASRSFNVEEGYPPEGVQMQQGWLFPARGRAQTPGTTDTRFYPKNGGFSKNRKKGDAIWTGALAHSKKRIKQKNKPHPFLAETAREVMGDDGEKVYRNMLIRAERLVTKLEEEKRVRGEV
jgi:hypothetical protein